MLGWDPSSGYFGLRQEGMADQRVESEEWSSWRGSGVRPSVLPPGSPGPPTRLPKPEPLLFHKLEAEAQSSCPWIHQPAHGMQGPQRCLRREVRRQPLRRLALKEGCWPSRPISPTASLPHSASLEQLLGLLEVASGHRNDHECW